ncbi:hypothetical protein PAXINDRAFT_18029 [Paxillus involutus ATCC 200175]|uniref:Uncharacterized protein n=1 Tax=Paxillus involutus ATCC 200175 TaxID=664439 RepID=A0A0C9TCW9_PAXIN|nr:hypothetical protein PAXINDRAFT_18029 [Paxillus involutus ATCC 200175]
MAEFPALAVDGRNWSTWRENLERTLNGFRIGKYLNETTPNPYDARAHALAKCIFALTIHPSLLARIRHLKSVHEGFKTLQNLLEKESTSTTGRLYEIRNDNTKREAAHSPETANDRGDTSRCDDEVRNGSRGSNNHVPRSETRREHKRERRSQGRVEKGPGVGEKGGVSKGEKDDEKVAAVSGVSLVKPTSSQEDLPGTRVDPPRPHHHSKSPSPSPTTHSLLFEQTAPTSRRPTRQRTQQQLEEAARRYLARRKREDGEGSRRGVESRDRGSREAVDEDGEDDDVHHAQVEPQQPQTVGQTAVVDEAADTTDPHANSAGPAVPVGTTNEPSNGVDEGVEEGDRRVEEEDEKGGRASESAALSSNDNGGDEDVRHAYAVPKPAPPSPYHVPPSPDERRPPSVPLEGEMTGKQSSGHADEAATHLERPPDESTTQLPGRTPYDQTSNGEGRGEAVNGDDEVEVEGSKDDDRKASNGVDGRQRRNDDASRDEGSREVDREVEGTRGDQEGQENREGGRQVERTTNANVPPEPPPPPSPSTPPPSPLHPERRDVDVDTARTCKTAARTRADAVHDPGVETDSPGNKPPSVRLEGESGKRSSRHVETDDDHVEVDHDTQLTPRSPVGTPDGDERRPNGPTEPPDEVEGGRGGIGEPRGTSRVETVESRESRRVDQPEDERVEPGDRGVEETKSKEVEGEIGGQIEGDGGHRDGRTVDTGSPTSGTSRDSKRVETGALPDNETSQQHNGKPSTSTNVPGPPRPPPYATNRPTHIANPPRRRGRLKTPPTNVSKPERTDPIGCDGNGTELQGECPKATTVEDEGHQGPYVDTDTVDTTIHTRELPYRVITPA